MAFDLGELASEKRRWIRVGLEDMEIEIRRVTPKDRERFRQKMIRDGIQKDQEGFELNPGRFDSYFAALAAAFVTGWRHVAINGVENPEYSAEEMGRVLAQSNSALAALGKALGEEADFFFGSEPGSAG